MIGDEYFKNHAILVVEDDRLFRNLAVKVLDEEGYSVGSVKTALEALEILHVSSNISLLVTDINLPGMNGLELVRLAQQQFPSLKVLIMSGRHRIDAERLAQPAEFLQKPFSANSFLSRVKIILEK